MADITAIPGRLNVTVWHGNTEQIELTWPAGSLDGTGPWTAAATFGPDPLNLPVTVVGDVQTITLPAATADHLHEPGSWELKDGSSGDVEIAGTFRVTDQAGPSVVSATVQIVDETVTVSVLSDAPVSSVNGQTGAVVLDAGDVGADPAGSAQTVADDLTTHEALNIGDVHGVRAHDWRLDGTTGLTRLVMTQDGANAFSLAAVGDVGEWSASTAAGSQREAWRLAGTDWADSEMVSLLEGSDTLVGGDLAQWGHLHRLQFDGALWHAYAIWTDALFAQAWILNINVVTFDGATLNQGGGGGGGLEDRVGRQLGILRAERASNTVTVHCTGPWLPPVGTSVTVAGMGGFDGTFTTTGRSTRQRTVTWTQAGADVIDADAGGTITPAAPPRQWMPYMFASRVIGDEPVTIQAKQWRPEEIDEPSWADPERVDTVTITSASDPAPHGGTGDCALWVGHLSTGNAQRYGPVVARRLLTS